MDKISNISEVSPDGDISMGTIYELNKEAYNKIMPYNEDQLKENLEFLYEWTFNKGAKYYMLLCKERSDYTVFNFSSLIDKKYHYGITKDLKECLKNRGVILDIRYVQDTDAWEIWLRSNGESFMFMFFECNDFIIEV